MLLLLLLLLLLSCHVPISHFGTTGLATAVGEQPIKGLLDNGAQARMTAGEALTNLMWAKVNDLIDTSLTHAPYLPSTYHITHQPHVGQGRYKDSIPVLHTTCQHLFLLKPTLSIHSQHTHCQRNL